MIEANERRLLQLRSQVKIMIHHLIVIYIPQLTIGELENEVTIAYTTKHFFTSKNSTFSIALLYKLVQ